MLAGEVVIGVITGRTGKHRPSEHASATITPANNAVFGNAHPDWMFITNDHSDSLRVTTRLLINSTTW